METPSEYSLGVSNSTELRPDVELPNPVTQAGVLGVLDREVFFVDHRVRSAGRSDPVIGTGRAVEVVDRGSRSLRCAEPNRASEIIVRRLPITRSGHGSNAFQVGPVDDDKQPFAGLVHGEGDQAGPVGGERDDVGDDHSGDIGACHELVRPTW